MQLCLIIYKNHSQPNQDYKLTCVPQKIKSRLRISIQIIQVHNNGWPSCSIKRSQKWKLKANAVIAQERKQISYQSSRFQFNPWFISPYMHWPFANLRTVERRFKDNTNSRIQSEAKKKNSFISVLLNSWSSRCKGKANFNL